jgi:hypothetical protein
MMIVVVCFLGLLFCWDRGMDVREEGNAIKEENVQEFGTESQTRQA